MDVLVLWMEYMRCQKSVLTGIKTNTKVTSSTKPLVTTNVTCNHMREFIGCDWDFPATWNNKTTVLYDEFTRGIYTGDILPEYEFELYEYD